MSRRASGRLGVAAMVAVLLLAGWWLASPYLRSAALLADLTGTGGWWRPLIPIDAEPVRERDLAVPTRFGPIPGRVYTPEHPEFSIVVFPGIHAGGVDEPRLVDLSRRIAQRGALVLTVPLPDLRAYRITPRATDMIEDATGWMAAEPSLAPTGRVGLVGVSFAGGLAMVAAGRPSLADRLTAIFGLGIHADLPRVLRYLTAVDVVAPPGPPHDYGVVLMLREALPAIVPPEQLAALDEAIVGFLDASSATSTDAALADRLFEDARRREATLPELSRTIMRAVNARDVAALGRLLTPLAERIGGDPALSPLRSALPQVPVFLLHGETDNVVPSEESRALAFALTEAGNTRATLLLTPLVTHADAHPDAAPGDLWRLVVFWTRLWNAFGD